MDIIIRELELVASIGVYDWEKTILTPLKISVQCRIDGNKAIEKDDVAETLDYDQLKHIFETIIQQGHYQLIETLAAKLLNALLEQPFVHRATLEVEKVGALKGAKSVSVRVKGKKTKHK